MLNFGYSQPPDDLFAGYIDQGIRVVQIENYMLIVRAQAAREAAL